MGTWRLSDVGRFPHTGLGPERVRARLTSGDTDVSDLIPAPTAPARRRRTNRIPYPEPRTVNYNGASALTGLSISTLTELVAAGKIRSTIAGGRRLLFMDSIEDLLQAGVAKD
jgi:hypothetical protein